MCGPPNHSPRPFLLALSSYILALSFSQMTRYQAMLNRPQWKGSDVFGPHTFHYLSLTRKITKRVKVSSPIHLLIWLCFRLPPLPSFLPFPQPQSLGHCQHSGVAAAWSVCLGCVGEEKEGRVKHSSLQLQLTEASCQHDSSRHCRGHPEAVFVGARLL